MGELDKLEKLRVIEEVLEEIEDEHNVRIFARGGAYGSASLVIRDNDTKEEHVVD